MWIYHSATRPASAGEIASDAGTFIRVGRPAVIGRATPYEARQRNPQAPLYERVRFSFGISMGGQQSRHTAWTARLENLRTSSAWAHLTRCRGVVALDAYATTIDERHFWFECLPGEVAYACCLYEGHDRGGFAVITEPTGVGDERRPLLITERSVETWLDPTAVPPLGMIPALERAHVPQVAEPRRAATFGEAARGVLSAIASLRHEDRIAA